MRYSHLVLFLGLSCGVEAQRYFFEKLSVDNDLLTSKVYATLQDSTGLVWLGTEVGLASYDGSLKLSTFGPDEGMAPRGVRSLFLDREKRLWCGHLGGGVSVSEGRKFRKLTFDGEPLTDDITAIQQDAQGGIWLGTFGHGALRIDALTKEGVIPAKRFSMNEGLGERITSITRMHDGSLIFLDAGAGLRKWDPKSNKFLPFLPPGMTDVAKITSFFEDGQGGLWVGTQEQGAFHIDPKSKNITSFDVPTGMPSSFVYCFGEDDAGRVWIGTYDGGAVRIEQGKPHAFDQTTGLPSRFIRAIGRDREGNMLMATNDEGLEVYKGERFRSYTKEDGLVDPQVWTVLESKDGKVWFGTNAGITVFDPAVGGKAGSRVINAQGSNLTSNDVRCMREDANGHIWIGTDNAGLNEYDPGSGRFTYVVGLSDLVGDNKITALEFGMHGELYVGTVGGLIRIMPGGVPEVLRTSEGLAGDNIKALFKDGRGKLWIGSANGGVSLIDPATPSKAQVVDMGRVVTPTSFTEDAEGRIWVGTEGQGVVLLLNGKVVESYDVKTGLLSNNVRSLITDQNGHVWIGTNKGLNKRRKGDDVFIAFSERSGFTGKEAKPGAVCRTRKGGLWFGTVNGAILVSEDKGSEKSEAPIISVRVLKVNLEERDPVDGVDLSNTERDVRIEYGSVSLSDPDAVRYQYQLEGLDNSWQPITAETNAHYPGLSPGRYTFKVKARNRSGIWSDPPAEYHFTILPPWYRTWWFLSSCAVLMGIGAYSYVKFRERQLRTRNQILERKVQERTAEVVRQSDEIAGQKVKIEDLLLNILPREISEELKLNGKATARHHSAVTVMFTDMKGFTKVAEKMTPEQLVNELDECFVRFDDIIGHYGIEKIKTIGDSYMSACGVPTGDKHHAVKAVMAALEVREDMRRAGQQRLAEGGEPWVLRIGVHTGAVVAGVVGKRKFAYDIWGDAVNTASRMESSGEPGEVNISGATYELVKDYFVCDHRGQIEAKNKGKIDMYFVRRLKPEYSGNAEGTRPNATLCKMIGIEEVEFA